MEPAPTTKAWLTRHWKTVVFGGIGGGLVFTVAFFFGVFGLVQAILTNTRGYEEGIERARASAVVERVVGHPFTVGSFIEATLGSSYRMVLPPEPRTAAPEGGGNFVVILQGAKGRSVLHGSYTGFGARERLTALQLEVGGRAVPLEGFEAFPLEPSVSRTDQVRMTVLGLLFMLLIWWPPVYLMVLGGWRVLGKAGRPGWTILVPFYNALQLLRVAGAPWWFLPLLFVPVANIIVAVLASMRLARAFGKDSAFGIGLFFVPFVFLSILGLGTAQHRGPRSQLPPPLY